MNAEQLITELKSLCDSTKVEHSQRFFKTGKGEYGEGDVFWAVKVPTQRIVAKKYRDLPLAELAKLIEHEVHEVRLTTAMLLVYKYNKAKTQEAKKQIVDFYIDHIAGINNWDIVDTSAHNIIGEYIFHYDDKKLLEKVMNMYKADSLWLRRISIMTTYALIKHGVYEPTLIQAERLLHDKADLIHKAVGWMLREVGNRDLAVEEEFLEKHYKQMPRTMLRYAIEKFAPDRREVFMKR